MKTRNAVGIAIMLLLLPRVTMAQGPIQRSIQLSAASLFAQSSATAPQAPVPTSLTLDQYAYVTSQNSYIVTVLSGIRDTLQTMQQLKQTSDATYMQRIGELEQKLAAVIDDNAPGNGKQWTNIIGSLAAAGTGFYTATRNCPPVH